MTVNHTPFRSDLFTSGGAVCSTQCRLADLLTVRRVLPVVVAALVEALV